MKTISNAMTSEHAPMMRFCAVETIRDAVSQVRREGSDRLDDRMIGMAVLASSDTGPDDLAVVVLGCEHNDSVRSVADSILKTRRSGEENILDLVGKETLVAAFFLFGAKSMSAGYMTGSDGGKDLGGSWMSQVVFPDMSNAACWFNSADEAVASISSHAIGDDESKYPSLNGSGMEDGMDGLLMEESDDNSIHQSVRLIGILQASDKELIMY